MHITGDMITDGKYDNIYEYDKNGTKTSNLLIPIKNSIGDKLIPAKIFAQDGILRGVYKTNAWWGIKQNYTFEYFKKLFGDKVSGEVENVKIANSIDELELICVRKEFVDDNFKTKYINPTTKTSQGIGSGAGYIELDNGTYTIDPSLN